MKHRVTREGDENVCSCGLRWGVDEHDPHALSGVDLAVPDSERTVTTSTDWIDKIKKDIEE